MEVGLDARQVLRPVLGSVGDEPASGVGHVPPCLAREQPALARLVATARLRHGLGGSAALHGRGSHGVRRAHGAASPDLGWRTCPRYTDRSAPSGVLCAEIAVRL